MAAFLCSPGCLLCRWVVCPHCLGDFMCETCWAGVQEYVWFEEFEADVLGVADDEAGGLGDPEQASEGSPTTCPPPSDELVAFSAATSPGDHWSPISGVDSSSSSASPTETASPLGLAASAVASTVSADSDWMECPACCNFVEFAELCSFCLSRLDD